MNKSPFRSIGDYELFIYSLPERYPQITESSLTLVRAGARLARVAGRIHIGDSWAITVVERFRWDREPIVLDAYGYEIWKGPEKQWWYDPQPHPEEASLQSTFPHHKHVPPNIRKNRIPAPGISFSSPNIPFLIGEVFSWNEPGSESVSATDDFGVR